MDLKRSQEIDNVLLFLSPQPIKVIDDPVGLAPGASVFLDSFHQVGCASVVEEEDALSNPPERSGSEFIGAGAPLRDAIRKTFSHVVDK
jgi:hypothetical protein